MLWNAYTPDLPWILRSGQYILEQFQLPTHDIFSWTYPEKPWVLYQWLFEAITFAGYRILGEQGLLKTFIVLVLGLYLLLPLALGSRSRIPLLFSLLIPSMALFTAAINISLRPMIITSIFLAVQFLLLQEFRRGKFPFRWLLLSVAGTYTLWANLHTGVVLGLISLGLMAIGDGLERKRWYSFSPVRTEMEGKPAPLKGYAILLGIGFLFSLLNPYGVLLYQYLAELSAQTYLNDAIVELQSPDFHRLNYWYFAALLAVFMGLMARANRIFGAGEILHLLAFTIATLFAQRFVVWACLFYALILPKALYHGWIDWQNPPRFLQEAVKNFETYRFLLIAVLSVALIGFFAYSGKLMAVRYGGCHSLLKGIDAYQGLRLASDRVFMEPEIGSCMLIRHPDVKVFVDTRFDFYGTDFTKQGKDILDLSAGWNALLDEWRIDTVIITKRWPLAHLLKLKPDYKLLYQDHRVVIFRRRPVKPGKGTEQ